MPEKYDVIIIGAGIVGCSIARELSQYQLKILVLEKEADVARGASGANSGVIHSGFKEPLGSLKSKYSAKGNKKFEQIAVDLDIPFKRIGTYTIGETEKDREKLLKLKKSGEKAGAKGLRIIEAEELKKLEPHVKGKFALLAPSGGITDPILYTIAIAENALQNGTSFSFNNEVTNITKKVDGYNIHTTCDEYNTNIIINSAGIYSDKIAEMVGYKKYTITPNRGEYFILDKKIDQQIDGMIYPIPPEKTGSIGTHLTPTIHGNLLIGPTAEYITTPDDVSTTISRDTHLTEGALKLVPTLDMKHVIHEYAGLRAKIIKPGEPNKGDFIIEQEPKNFIQLIGIESPGLTAAPIIAQEVAQMVKQNHKLSPNPKFNPKRKAPVKISKLTVEQKNKLIQKQPGYGQIICRCEEVSKQEILNAYNNPLGVKNLKAIQTRTRAGFGRCQGGFCTPNILKLLRDEGIDISNFTAKGKKTNICSIKTR